MAYECSTIYKSSEIDSFEHGCLGAPQDSTINHKIVSSSLADIKLQIRSLLGCGEEALTIDACEEVGRIDAGFLENASGSLASVSELAGWERGELTLYYVNYSFCFEQVTRVPAVFPVEVI